METFNNIPVMILRQNNRSFKARKKQLDHRVRNKKHLRQEIFSNHNIFHSNINLYRNMAAQDIFWDKNYNFKCIINEAKEENSSLKAKIWNMEKENRRMERQLETWNIDSHSVFNPNKKPYIDMATVQTVLSDQDYQIVSMKMLIFDLQKESKKKDLEIGQLNERNKDFLNISRLLNHETTRRKVEIFECIESKTARAARIHPDARQKLGFKMIKQNGELDLIIKNTELKRRSKLQLQNELASILGQISEHSKTKEEEIQTLKEEIKVMRTEEDGGVSLVKEKLSIAEQNTLQYQCLIQEKMNKFIEAKIPLEIEIDKLMEMLEADRVQSRVRLSFQ